MDAIRDVLPRTADAIAGDFAAGQHKGFQLYVSLRGETVTDAAAGESAPSVPMTPNTLVCWLSSGKPLTAMAVGLTWQWGRFALDDAVAEYIPEFGANGKERITVRHLLTHTGGFPAVETRYPEATWKETVAAICDAPLADDWAVGRTAGYHVSSSWFVLGELVRRVTLRPVEDVVRRDICEPAGMVDTWLAVPEKRAAAYGDRIGWMWGRAGKTLEPLNWHQPPRLNRVSPGSSTRGPVRDLGRLYERLLAVIAGDHTLNSVGGGPFTSQTIEALVSPHRVGEFDRTFQHVVDFGLGFVVNSNRYGPDTVPYGFGRHASPRAFGHGGAQSSIGFADPEHGLVVAWAANAQIGEPRHNARNRAINTAIYEDLGLT